MIKVYQIQLTDAEIAIVNSDDGDRDYLANPRIKAYFDRSFESTFKAENFQYYTHVATVDTNDMEEAFTAMNKMADLPMTCYERCASMSVGDILELEDGSKYRCASFGFTAL
jgi:hypothetical protein